MQATASFLALRPPGTGSGAAGAGSAGAGRGAVWIDTFRGRWYYRLSMKLGIFSLIALTAAGSFFLSARPLPARSEAYRLEIEAVERERVNLPVAVDLPLSERGRGRWSARLRREDGTERPAQVEVLEQEGGRLLRVYWTEPEIAAGESAVYRLTLSPGVRSGGGEEFRLEHEEGHQELLFGARRIFRYVTAYEAERHAETHKPYHQLYDREGENFITKGPGGQYSHHKGIFLGWNQTRVGEEEMYDFWHAPREYQQHRSFLRDRQMTGPVVARSVSTTDWKTPEGEAVVRDTRDVRTWRLPGDELLLDFEITIEALEEDVHLGGDAHHAGFQFRASQEVAENPGGTFVLHPEGAERQENDIWSGAAWMAIGFDAGDRPYTVVHMDHPEQNPADTTYSVRDYGRFGAFFTADVAREKPLVLNYRLLVIPAREGAGLSVEALEGRHADFMQPPVVRWEKQ